MIRDVWLLIYVQQFEVLGNRRYKKSRGNRRTGQAGEIFGVFPWPELIVTIAESGNCWDLRTLTPKIYKDKFQPTKLPPSCLGTVWSIVTSCYLLISNFPGWNDFPKFLFTMGELFFGKVWSCFLGQTFQNQVDFPKGRTPDKGTWSKSQLGGNFSGQLFQYILGVRENGAHGEITWVLHHLTNQVISFMIGSKLRYS